MIPSKFELEDATLESLLGAAHGALDRARPITRRWFRQTLEVHDKVARDASSDSGGRPMDPVTRADREAEQALRDALQESCPELGFLGEETGASRIDGAPHWVVDPIDGTRAYISGMPLWGTLLALNDGQMPVLGFLDQPVLDERYVGTRTGTELHCADGVRPLRTRRDRCLSSATQYCTSPAIFTTEAEREAFERVSRRAALSLFGGDCYAYAMLASGFVDVVVEAGLQTYDIQALIPIVKGAGGCITDWQGGSAVAGGCVLASAHPELHEEVLDVIGGHVSG